MNQFYASGKKNILITGGAGFMGSHLAEELIKENHVIAVDNFISSSERNIDHLLQRPNFELIKHDITAGFDLADDKTFPELKEFETRVQGVQEVYHLACPTSPKDYQKFPVETLTANSHGTKNALDIALKWKARFTFVSSSAVYGQSENQDLISEEYVGRVSTTSDSSCYDEGKRFAESMTHHYGKKYNIPISIARVFSTYGPRMRINDGRMIPDFIMAALTNKPIEIQGDENSTIVYCYVSDMVEGLIKYMQSEITEPLNLGGIEEYKIGDIAKEIIRLTGSGSEIIFKGNNNGNEEHRSLVPDINKAKEKLMWIPLTRLTDGLTKTIEDMKVNMHRYGI